MPKPTPRFWRRDLSFNSRRKRHTGSLLTAPVMMMTDDMVSALAICKKKELSGDVQAASYSDREITCTEVLHARQCEYGCPTFLICVPHARQTYQLRSSTMARPLCAPCIPVCLRRAAASRRVAAIRHRRHCLGAVDGGPERAPLGAQSMLFPSPCDFAG